MTRPKIDPREHGTEITVESLKPEQRQWFSKAANRSILKREFSRAYSAMLRPRRRADHVSSPSQWIRRTRPAALRMGQARETRHGEVTSPGLALSAAYQAIDVNLPTAHSAGSVGNGSPPTKPYARRAYQTPMWCQRHRSIRGWIGIQRYLSKTEFGIDLLRHGRKIEIANKDLFQWMDGDNAEPEYPIDDPRQRGRIVGEIHSTIAA